MAPVLYVQMPVFGAMTLRRRTLDDPRSDPLGYVELEGKPDKLQVAIRRAGQWRTLGGKPFRSPVLAWYSIERADGSPVL